MRVEQRGEEIILVMGDPVERKIVASLLKGARVGLEIHRTRPTCYDVTCSCHGIERALVHTASMPALIEALEKDMRADKRGVDLGKNIIDGARE